MGLRGAIARLAGAQARLRGLLSLFRPGHFHWLRSREKQAGRPAFELPPLDDSSSRSAAVVAVVQRSRSRPLAVRRQGSSGGVQWAPQQLPRQDPGPLRLTSSRNPGQSTTSPDIRQVFFLPRSFHGYGTSVYQMAAFYPSRLVIISLFIMIFSKHTSTP